MTELAQILRVHAKNYPEMQPTDAVKLLYQNEFGGGHMIADPKGCMDYLHREYQQIPHDPTCAAYEPIGNGIVRVNLAALRAERLDALGEAFIASAARISGSKDRFLQSIDILCKLTAEGIFSFDGSALAAYLTDYAAAGYPAVSHSPQYRDAYHPAYRVILEVYLPRLL